MSSPDLARPVELKAWHQSSVTTYLRCPRRFELRFVQGLRPDHTVRHFGAELGTADHAGVEHILRRATAGEEPERQEVLDVVLQAFEDAVARSQERGALHDESALQGALERLEGERLDRLMLLATDPRIHAVEWRGVEWQFELREARHGRVWRGTLDAWGKARQDLEQFGVLGREPVSLREGDVLVCDWKTGELPPFGRVERIQSVQLGIYAMALAQEFRRRGEWWNLGARRRTFLASLRDLDRPKAPKDQEGNRIPKNLPRSINPAWLKATGLTEEQAKGSKKRPKDRDGNPIPKWIEGGPNPAYEAACGKPRGPVFHEALVDYPSVLRTIRHAVRGVELGVFPASGAATGQCPTCPYARVCAGDQDHEDHEGEDQ